jgi:methionine aminotransferase
MFVLPFMTKLQKAMHFSGSIHSKLSGTGTSIFSVMSKLAMEKNAVNLSQGFPDFDCSTELTELVCSAMKENKNQYAPMPGIIGLRQSIAVKTERLYHSHYHPETEITITAGATQAIFTAIQSIIRPGDEVIIIQPAYDCYAPAVLLAGGILVTVDLFPPDYKINWEEIEGKVNSRTRMIIVNSPGNPSCKVFSAEDILSLERITRDSEIVILSDEVYEHIIFDGQEHNSVSRSPELRERSFVIASFGKSFHVTGWKIGYVLAPENLMSEFRKVHQFNVFSVNTPMQYAIAEYMKNSDNYSGLGKFYQQKRDLFLETMAQTPFKPLPSFGTYFQLMDFAGFSTLQDKEFAIWLTESAGVACVPLSPFYLNGTDNKVVRFCFAKKEQTLLEAGHRLSKFFSS